MSPAGAAISRSSNRTMSYYEQWVEEQDRAADAEHAEWLRTQEGAAWKREHERVVLAVGNDRLRHENQQLEKERERRKQERAWKREHPTEWRAWVRVQPLLELPLLFGDEKPFGFDAFRVEVGHAPPGVRRVVRKDRSLPYQQRNLRWGRPCDPKTAPPVVAAVGAQLVQGGREEGLPDQEGGRQAPSRLDSLHQPVDVGGALEGVPARAGAALQVGGRGGVRGEGEKRPPMNSNHSSNQAEQLVGVEMKNPRKSVTCRGLGRATCRI